MVACPAAKPGGLQLADQALQPTVADSDRAGVHLVAEVRHDEGHGGKPAGGQVGGEAAERQDPVAAGGVVPDAGGVHEGVDGLGVCAGVRHGAGPGEAFQGGVAS
jgi:hypothetical protein